MRRALGAVDREVEGLARDVPAVVTWTDDVPFQALAQALDGHGGAPPCLLVL